MTTDDHGIRIEPLTGARIGPVVADLARLRMTVFRDWPYLYDGSLDYERDYLAGFAQAAAAIVVVARQDDTIVGAATAAPVAGHTDDFAPLLAAAGYDPQRVFYFGESVLLPSCRGRGIGHAFFDHREAHARASIGPAGAYTHAAFCAVVRDPADPRTPPGYRPLDPFWLKRGFAPVPGLVGSYDWQEIGSTAQTAHPMQFWVKPL